MARSILKIEHQGEVRYLEWSSITDSPATYGMTLDELHEYVREEYGQVGLRELPSRLERVERTGTSSHVSRSVQELIECNRAGPNESRITLDEIWQRYVVERPTDEEDDDETSTSEG